jgi:hypothetical protein
MEAEKAGGSCDVITHVSCDASAGRSHDISTDGPSGTTSCFQAWQQAKSARHARRVSANFCILCDGCWACGVKCNRARCSTYGVWALAVAQSFHLCLKDQLQTTDRFFSPFHHVHQPAQ